MTDSSKVEAFLSILRAKSEGHCEYWAEYGRVYVRVVVAPLYNGVAHKDHRSVYCFIRIKDGAILKAASFKAPAKGVRAWLDDILVDSSRVTHTTGWLYRYL